MKHTAKKIGLSEDLQPVYHYRGYTIQKMVHSGLIWSVAEGELEEITNKSVGGEPTLRDAKDFVDFLLAESTANTKWGLAY